MSKVFQRQRVAGSIAIGSGFTLVEMLLALSVSGLIGTAVLFMLSGAASASQAQTDTRKSTVSRQVVITRLSSLLRCNAVVLAVDDVSIVLWKGDQNANGKPDLSELRRLEWDVDTAEVWLSESPANLLPESDVAFALNDDFATISLAASGSVSFPRQVVLNHIQSWSLTLDKVALADARLLRLDVVLVQQDKADVATVICSLRASSM